MLFLVFLALWKIVEALEVEIATAAGKAGMSRLVSTKNFQRLQLSLF
jgi:hypothetical protein